MTNRRFENLIAWQKSRDLAKRIYTEFRTNKDYSFRDQICRASISISNNIAEGFARDGSKEFRRFLDIARGSSQEVKSMLYLAQDLNMMNETEAENLRAKADEVSRIIYSLKRSLK